MTTPAPAGPDPVVRPDPVVVARLRAAGCVFAEDEAALLTETCATPEELERLVRRRVAGDPLEQLLGWAQFGDLRLAVRPGVFVPRSRTRVLVREATRLLGDSGVVLDLCCGTGAIGAALLAAVPGLDVHAADVDPAAVACARENLAAAGGQAAQVYLGDLFAPVPARLRGGIAVLAVNAPYVPTGDIAFMPTEARDHEARAALDGGPDGSAVHRRVLSEAAAWLVPGGSLLIESGSRQSALVARLMDDAGFAARVVHDDELDGTAVVGRLREPTISGS